MQPVDNAGRGSANVSLRVFSAGAPASSIAYGERAVILQPRTGKLLVTDLYVVRNESSPPATFAPDGPTLRFFVPASARQTVQASVQGAGGIPVPLEVKPEAVKPEARSEGAFGVRYPLKPGESRFEITYQMDYPGSLNFETRAIEKIGQTRLAVSSGVTTEGEGIRFMATEPRMKFSIFNVTNSPAWSAKLTGEGREEPAASGGEAAEGDAGGESAVTNMRGFVDARWAFFLAGIGAVLGAGFFRLWRANEPLGLAQKPSRSKRG